MSVEKLSVSMESALVKLVKSAASEDGISVSTWLAEAARARARHHALREAVTQHAGERGGPSSNEARVLVESARRRSALSRPPRKRSR